MLGLCFRTHGEQQMRSEEVERTPKDDFRVSCVLRVRVPPSEHGTRAR